MALTSQNCSIIYISDGEKLEYAVPFKFFSKNDLALYLVDANGIEAEQQSNFEVFDENNDLGGKIKFIQPLDKGSKFIIRRRSKVIQESVYPEGGLFHSTHIENDFDKIVAMLQEAKEIIDRAVLLPIGSDLDKNSLIFNFFEAYKKMESNFLAIQALYPKILAEVEKATQIVNLGPAGASKLGLIKVGANLSITADGVLSAEKFTLPQASSSTLGGVKLGSGLEITPEGVMSVLADNNKADSDLSNVQISVKNLGVAIFGTVSLSDNAIHYGVFTSTTTFVLPTIAVENRYKQHQIKLYLNQAAARAYNWGTSYRYNDMTGITGAGYWAIYWDFDPVRNAWVVGQLKIQ